MDTGIKTCLGSYLVGCTVDIILFGVVLHQFFSYFTRYVRDKKWVRALVIGMMVQTTLQSLQTFLLLWVFNTIFSPDPNAPLSPADLLDYQLGHLPRGPFGVDTPLTMVFTACYVQTFFAFRLFVISGRRRWIPIPILLMSATAFASCIILVLPQTSRGVDTGFDHFVYFQFWIGLCSGSMCLADILICSLMIHYFRVHKNGPIQRSPVTSIMKDLTYLSIYSIAPSTTFAICSLVTSQLPNPTAQYTNMAFSFPTSKLYALSMMFTLNSRFKIRQRSSLGDALVIQYRYVVDDLDSQGFEQEMAATPTC